MDVNFINPFLEAFSNVIPQLGFSEVKKEGVKLNGKYIKSLGVVVIIGIVGDIKGNIIYTMTLDSAKKIASKMMMGMPVESFDEMAQSAISELINMLTANTAINFSKDDINIDISTPTLIQGDFTANASVEKVICVGVKVDDIEIETNISLEKNTI